MNISDIQRTRKVNKHHEDLQESALILQTKQNEKDTGVLPK